MAPFFVKEEVRAMLYSNAATHAHAHAHAHTHTHTAYTGLVVWSIRVGTKLRYYSKPTQTFE